MPPSVEGETRNVADGQEFRETHLCLAGPAAGIERIAQSVAKQVVDPICNKPGSLMLGAVAYHQACGRNSSSFGNHGGPIPSVGGGGLQTQKAEDAAAYAKS